MTFWGAVAGGAVGAVVLAGGLNLSQELGWTRMDLPIMFGTIFTENRLRAKAIGYAINLGLGIVGAAVYGGIFAAVGHAGWLFGLALGAVHGLFVGGGLVSALLPAIHPRMGTPWSDAKDTSMLEPPGFMLRNYGTGTAAVTFVLHLAYGAIVGAFAAGL